MVAIVLPLSPVASTAVLLGLVILAGTLGPILVWLLRLWRIHRVRRLLAVGLLALTVSVTPVRATDAPSEPDIVIDPGCDPYLGGWVCIPYWWW